MSLARFELVASELLTILPSHFAGASGSIGWGISYARLMVAAPPSSDSVKLLRLLALPVVCRQRSSEARWIVERQRGRGASPHLGRDCKLDVELQVGFALPAAHSRQCGR